MARSSGSDDFTRQAEQVLALPVVHRVNRLGGYGPDLAVIYEAHPRGCPSVLVDSRADCSASFMSNGSVAFTVKLPEGMDVSVLDASFDMSEKRETGVPSQNVWLATSAGGRRHIASLVNPKANIDVEPASLRVVKLGDPDRAMWYCATFAPARGVRYESAVKLSFVVTPRGPGVLRQVFVRNVGAKPLSCSLWTYFNLHGTQRFVYNKDLWYDAGLPVGPNDVVVAATVPYSDILQVKRLSSRAAGFRFVDATCDYATFVGDTAATALLPDAVRAGSMLPGGAGRRLNRFSTPTIAANRFDGTLAPGKSACLQQSLLYVTDAEAIERFRRLSAADTPSYRDMARAFASAARALVRGTPGVVECLAAQAGGTVAERSPYFQVALPAQPAASAYANSVWTGVKELYENCRAHGAKLAQGIELGTRDRAQDMWPKMKEDPGRVRADLGHALSMMYVTCDGPPATDHRLTLREKLHGMFPRQYPSRWDDRAQEIHNDNRPYNDSALWLLNSLCMYVRETGDAGVLAERVGTVRLTDPDRPETSGLLGCERELSIAEVMLEVLECHRRHTEDTPYGMAQILYGDWCDPIDMYGTSVVGDPRTRGAGRGVQARLSAHLFLTLVETIDLFDSPRVGEALNSKLLERVGRLRRLAEQLRLNVVKFAWEDGPDDFRAGFISAIHELRADGSVPDYAAGELGYTLGSMRGRDFDGANRRDLAAQAYGLAMLAAERDYLAPVPGADRMIQRLLRTINTLFFSPKLGLKLFTTPIANNRLARDLVGRMGIVPSGCAENGEYHHGQVMMHRFRLDVPGQADTVWKQFKPMMSAMRDESLSGPFETPCTSYASDSADPHFGKGMYFGLSGSVDWIVQVVHKLAGLELALHDPRRPDVSADPTLPAELNDEFTFRRVIHRAEPGGGYRQIPFRLRVLREGKGRRLLGRTITINDQPADRAEVADLSGADRVDIRIIYQYATR